MINMLYFIPRKSVNLKLTSFVMMFVGLLFATSIMAQNDLWIPKANLGDGSSSLKRSGAVGFSINGKVFIALGKDGSNYHTDVWEYDTIAETWTQKADFVGAGRIGAFAMVINNKAIIGTGSTTDGTLTNTVYKFEPVGNNWVQVANFDGGERSFASAFSIGTKGFVVGGNDGNLQSDLWEYDINADGWAGRQPFPGTARMKAIAFAIGTIGYYGTGDIGAGTASKDFWKYDINVNTWTQLADFGGSARMGSIGAATATKGYLGLGNDGSFLLDFWSYDNTTDTWTQQSDLPENARELAVAAPAGNKIYVGTGFGSSYLKDFFQWDPCAVPQIFPHPVGLDVCEGFDISFSVGITNPGTETYQWQKDGVNVPGANTNTLDIAGVTEAEEGSYTCEITNDCGTSVSDVANLDVTPIPITMPTGLLGNPDTLCPGNAFDISLTADDNGNNQDTLRWYSTACDGDLEGTGFPINSDLIVSAPDPLITTDYFARWENQCGASDCDTITIVVRELPVEPTALARSMDTICHDYNDELFLVSEGGSGDSLKWYLGDICNVPTAPYLGSGDTLDLFALGIIPTETSTYSARWETYCGGEDFTSTCLLIDVVVNGEISIAQHPTNKSVCEGTDPVKFGVLVNVGTSLTTINYQWYFEGAAISGATIDTLILAGGVTATDSGYYYCKVYNSCDTLASDSARLNINLEPTIIIQPSILDTICQGDSLTFTMQATGTEELQYQWYFNNALTASTDTFLTINPATFANTGDYFCLVTNGCGQLTTDTISMEVDTIPVITQQPEDLIVCLNSTAEFNMAANGTLPIVYQWYKIDINGVSSAIDGETANQFQISPVLEADTAFNYFCIVSNECSDGPSSDTVSLAMYEQILVMDSIRPDTNNICHNYSSYIDITAYGGNGDSIRWYTGSCEGTELAITVDTVITILVPSVTTTYYARWENTCGVSSCDSVTLNIVQNPVPFDTIYFEDNDICYNAYDSLLLTAVGGEGDSIYWYEINCSTQPFAVTTDTFVYVHNLPTNSYSFGASWVNICGESSCVTENLFIKYLTFITDQTEEQVVCEGTDALMNVVATGEDDLFYQWFFNGNEMAGYTESSLDVLTVSYADTGQYYCQVRSECDTTISDSIPLSLLELPHFTMQPYDVSTCEGESDTIQIKVAGESPILVQWYKDGFPFGGSALLDTLLIINPVVSTNDYFAKITNGCGETYSDTVTLRAFDTIVITQQPQYQNLCLLDDAVFSVTAEVTEFVEYEWYKVGGGIVGTGASLTLPSIDYDDAGAYYCIISDTCGELSTETVLLNMNRPPQVTTDPFGATVCEGTLFQFEVHTAGDSIVFQWYKDGSSVANESDSILRFNPIERGDEGEYYVSLVNNCGADQSVPVNLNVNYLPDVLDWVQVEPDSVCTICPHTTLSLTAYGDGGGYGDEIEWYEQGCDTDVIGTGANLVVDKVDITTWFFARWVNQCTDEVDFPCDSAKVTKVPDPLPLEGIAVDTNNFCADYPDSILLTGIGGSGRELRWYIYDTIGDNYLGTGGHIRVPAPPDTTHYVAFYRNMCGDSEYITKQVNVIPLPEVMVRESDTVCAMQPYQLEEVYANYYDSIIWTTSSPTGYFDTNNIQYPVYYDPAIDVYDTVKQYLTLTVFGISVCDNVMDSVELTYTPLPQITSEPGLLALCRDSSLTITAEGADHYFWRPLSDGLSLEEGNPITISPDETVDYYLIGVNGFGCTDSVLITVDVYPTPMVDLGDSIYLYSCEPVQLDAGGGDGSDYYIWSNGNRTRSITVYETGTYSVIVGNAGCEVDDTGFISLCNGKLFMPNAFSPNEDGINEILKPITSDPTIEFHMMIYDRWGKLLFETYDIHQGWDGNINGEPCPVGNYVYRLEYQGQGTDSPGKKASDVGTVMLIR